MSTNECVTVSQILDRYQAECLPELAPRTKKDYVRHLAKLRQEFGHFIADDLEPKTFAPFLNVPKGKISRVRQLAVLSAAFTQAVSMWFIMKRNVLRDVKRPKSLPRDRLIKDEEFEELARMAQTRMRLAMYLALYTGQRQGDILSFRWSDLKDTEIDDPDNPGKKKTITELHIYQSKTRKRLAIRVTPKLESILDECWKLRNGGHQGSEFILPTQTGKRYTSEGFRAGWQRLMRLWMCIGGENFHFHDIRALAATKCKTPEIAMRLLGHTTLGMTMRVYRRGTERVDALEV